MRAVVQRVSRAKVTIQAANNGWTSGEGYDWYYTDPARTTQASLSAPYAWSVSGK